MMTKETQMQMSKAITIIVRLDLVTVIVQVLVVMIYMS